MDSFPQLNSIKEKKHLRFYTELTRGDTCVTSHCQKGETNVCLTINIEEYYRFNIFTIFF